MLDGGNLTGLLLPQQNLALASPSSARWTRDRLQALIKSSFGQRRVVIVANRRPQPASQTEAGREGSPAVSGLLSALIPLIEVSGGTWIGHDVSENKRREAQVKGQIDRQNNGQMKSPINGPINGQVNGQINSQINGQANGKMNSQAIGSTSYPTYHLRNVEIQEQDYEGYYNGFSNQGLWPLCHITYTQPQFKQADWQAYRRVNQYFAQAVLEETKGQQAVVFIQDYHLSLLAGLLKQKQPDLLIAHFWHIPWPHLDQLRTCPFHQEIINGLLGNDLLGFQTADDCANFIEGVKRTQTRQPRPYPQAIVPDPPTTTVKAFPISIDMRAHEDLATSAGAAKAMDKWRDKHQLHNKIIGIGIERLDYTKGLLQKMQAIEILLGKRPDLRGRFVFIQLAIRSRSEQKSYRELGLQLKQLVNKINHQHGNREWMPIILQLDAHNQIDLVAIERLAKFCVVSSLHDGMNLVAKEFCAARIDNQGVLILSEFTGSALELSGALMINPFAIDRIADAMIEAIAMEPKEQARRMIAMRKTINRQNIFRWGADIVQALKNIEGTGEQPCP